MDAMEVMFFPPLNTTMSASVKLLVVGVFVVIILMVVDRIVYGKQKF